MKCAQMTFLREDESSQKRFHSFSFVKVFLVFSPEVSSLLSTLIASKRERESL